MLTIIRRYILDVNYFTIKEWWCPHTARCYAELTI